MIRFFEFTDEFAISLFVKSEPAIHEYTFVNTIVNIHIDIVQTHIRLSCEGG